MYQLYIHENLDQTTDSQEVVQTQQGHDNAKAYANPIRTQNNMSASP